MRCRSQHVHTDRARAARRGPDRDLAGATESGVIPGGVHGLGFGSSPRSSDAKHPRPDRASSGHAPRGGRACRSGPGVSCAALPVKVRRIRGGLDIPHRPAVVPRPRDRGASARGLWRARGRRRHGIACAHALGRRDRARCPSASSGERRLRGPPRSSAGVPSLLEVSVHAPGNGAASPRRRAPAVGTAHDHMPDFGTVGLARRVPRSALRV